uniref:COP9 signalosome complex subunit 6 n=1 Tax=Neobodo designis TaxID=312471 RepID=A0A7S1Q3Q2_NEODS|mmetsp:Transcript_28960/g.89635  ORF Transcript_28960/g.89635 Transcript_28960/m.89635 type:complete len:312 (+) Transcript_28960:66-1001(+)|eukprot:CAMPEP_0174834584 /NCGR_PEP_ID=MMETSP1114-20130205/4907_1 /TAXON_ID=312471 /ORGANISM="Neobodo designis, Strain CCAP 1951/1" /LENGTH=311 /DNA_ID=CAMNT_0016068499 /DNA_START=61 /DNA_END=996 /DNA_ORIENTATION=-
MSLQEVPNAAAAPEVEPTTPVALHPLVIVNITDHYTRNVMASKDASKATRAVGALLGQQSGRKVEIFTSFELLYTVKGDTVVIDEAFLKERRDSFLAVFPDYDVVGWYTTGKGLSAGDIAAVHHGVFVSQHNESAVAVVLDAQPEAKSKNLPVYALETRANKSVAKVPFTVESEESERIGVDAAMKVDFASSGETGLEPAAMRLRSAVDMLQERIAVVVAYLEAVESGKIANPDYELLRRIADVVNQLPTGDAPQLVSAMRSDTRDALLIAFLGVVSKGSALLSHIAADSAILRDGAVGKKGQRLQMLQAL